MCRQRLVKVTERLRVLNVSRWPREYVSDPLEEVREDADGGLEGLGALTLAGGTVLPTGHSVLARRTNA